MRADPAESSRSLRCVTLGRRVVPCGEGEAADGRPVLFPKVEERRRDVDRSPRSVAPDSQLGLRADSGRLDAGRAARCDPRIPDLYAVLGVDPRSSDDIIRYAYRKKAARLHDARWRPGRAARRLAELNAAYEILGKPDRRSDYDRQRPRTYYYQQTARQEQILDDPSVLSQGGAHGQRAKRPRGGLRPWRRAACSKPSRSSAWWSWRSTPATPCSATATWWTWAGSRTPGPRSGCRSSRGRSRPPRRPSVLAAPTPTPRQIIVPAVNLPSPTATTAAPPCVGQAAAAKPARPLP